MLGEDQFKYTMQCRIFKHIYYKKNSTTYNTKNFYNLKKNSYKKLPPIKIKIHSKHFIHYKKIKFYYKVQKVG